MGPAPASGVCAADGAEISVGRERGPGPRRQRRRHPGARRLRTAPRRGDARCSLVQIWRRRTPSASRGDAEIPQAPQGRARTRTTPVLTRAPRHGRDRFSEESPRWLQAGTASGSSSGGWASSAAWAGRASVTGRCLPSREHVVADDVRFLGSIVSGRMQDAVTPPPRRRLRMVPSDDDMHRARSCGSPRGV